ncbi:hypothetical protein [Streptomyces sp. NBC_00582]|uniref:hypothetical protein n=1 Tax=Streptomyces sp. NBC_00582 TaxID=2975783 RepID=UPI002E81FADF|nr:hypothetical protein [Streptomyces sp. NBC_00582]WUB63692.1 hypothetical protein OG852_26510 [Streptomyces sp. NBC_00582]
MGALRGIAAPFVASGPTGVAVRTRLNASSMAWSLAPGRPQAMFARTVSCRTSVSCGSRVTYARSRAGGKSRTGTPSSSTRCEYPGRSRQLLEQAVDS